MPFKPFDLSGKVALVTGGNGGIGLAMADGLAQAGADIAIWGTKAGKNEAAAAQLSAHGVKVRHDVVDVSSEAAVNDAMAALIDNFGRLDSCFANAGVGGDPSKPFHEMSTDEYRRVLAVNLDGAFFTLRAAAGHMVARAKDGDPGGSLVAISSMSAISGAPRNQPYAATKGALLPMMKGLAVEYGKHGIRGNSIVPGWVVTDMARPMLETKGFQEKVLPRQPNRRWGEPEDFSGIAVYLASDASSAHTGQEFVICGGYTVF